MWKERKTRRRRFLGGYETKNYGEVDEKENNKWHKEKLKEEINEEEKMWISMKWKNANNNEKMGKE